MTPSSEAKEVLKLLKRSNNVLVQGAPGTGKTHLAAQVCSAFLSQVALPYNATGSVPFPHTGSDLEDIAEWLPSPERANRRVFSTVFHQGTKLRDFVSGIVPVADGGTLRFRVQRGVLLEAIEHSLQPDSTALVLIEEINRGPAVSIFGGSIVAIESDKRLGINGEPLATTASFESLGPDGHQVVVRIPKHLYLLATMNQADTSVEPLDIAFLRRWEHFRLEPSSDLLYSFFGLEPGSPVTDATATAKDLFHVAILAWNAVNERISVGRGPEFQIGHGVLMQPEFVGKGGPLEAASILVSFWERMRAHVEEIFFGDVGAVADVLNMRSNHAGHPYKLLEKDFAGGSRLQIVTQPTTRENVIQILRSVAGYAN